MIKILHCADAHLGINFSFTDDKKECANNIHLDTLYSMIENANRLHVSAILISGDLFHTPTVSAIFFSKVMNILSKANMKIYICCGNHDYYFADSPYAKFEIPSNVHIFKNSTLESIELEDFVLYSASFQNEHAEIDLTMTRKNNKPHILMLHGDIVSSSSGYNPISSAKLKDCDFDYIALGHNHSFSDIIKFGKTKICCPGCLMGTGFDETEQKGYVILDIAQNNKIEANFISSDGLEFVENEIDIAHLLNEQHLIDILNEKYSSGFDRTVIRLIITGQTQLNIDIIKLKKILSSYFFEISILDRTAEIRDFWVLRHDDSLCGEFVRVLWQDYQNTDDEIQKERILYALELGVLALEQ